MVLISVLVSLFLDRNLQLHREGRIQDVYGRIADAISSRLPAGREGLLSLLLVVLPPVLLIGLLQWLLASWLFGLASLAFAIVVLLLTLGPLDVVDSVDDYIEAARADDAERRAWYCQRLTGEAPPDDAVEEGRRVAASVFPQAHDHLFATLFWFVVLGPMGAVFYRMLAECALRPAPAIIARPGLLGAARHALGVLGWIPARLLAFGFAMTGQFDSTVQAFRRGQIHDVDLLDANRDLLVTTGTAALRTGEDSGEGAQTERRVTPAAEIVREARALAIRACVFWLAILALMTLAGWLG